jgi:hypothetical protein
MEKHQRDEVSTTFSILSVECFVAKIWPFQFWAGVKKTYFSQRPKDGVMGGPVLNEHVGWPRIKRSLLFGFKPSYVGWPKIKRSLLF